MLVLLFFCITSVPPPACLFCALTQIEAKIKNVYKGLQMYVFMSILKWEKLFLFLCHISSIILEIYKTNLQCFDMLLKRDYHQQIAAKTLSITVCSAWLNICSNLHLKVKNTAGYGKVPAIRWIYMTKTSSIFLFWQKLDFHVCPISRSRLPSGGWGCGLWPWREPVTQVRLPRPSISSSSSRAPDRHKRHLETEQACTIRGNM